MAVGRGRRGLSTKGLRPARNPRKNDERTARGAVSSQIAPPPPRIHYPLRVRARSAPSCDFVDNPPAGWQRCPGRSPAPPSLHSKLCVLAALREPIAPSRIAPPMSRVPPDRSARICVDLRIPHLPGGNPNPGDHPRRPYPDPPPPAYCSPVCPFGRAGDPGPGPVARFSLCPKSGFMPPCAGSLWCEPGSHIFFQESGPWPVSSRRTTSAALSRTR